MAEKVRCNICQQSFKDKDGLAQHIAAKHSQAQEHSSPQKRKNKRGIMIFVILIIGALLILLLFSVFDEDKECKSMPATQMNIGGHQNLELHIHAQLRILIDRNEQFIPANVGISSEVMRPLHTHDSTGEIHIESKCKRKFSIGEFFDVWGRAFTEQCIFDYCADKGTLKMYVNGEEHPELLNYLIKDGDSILIEYGSLR